MANKPKPQKASPEGQSEVKGDKIQEKEVVELSGRRIFLVRHGERNYLLNVTTSVQRCCATCFDSVIRQ
ncbi:hypothetical protein T4E_10049 [Trichinella pseudospiralis]|uniref:Uncharacterized protein n=1 Tax=Trichinella pseudospiralis TaxID=6337 RepID=A0A0V0YLS1_TRIPS|nr:hypothetical protein T4E_10049 [Trichinella pseudospiralis]